MIKKIPDLDHQDIALEVPGGDLVYSDIPMKNTRKMKHYNIHMFYV